jgi:hypothetical protein
MLIMVAFVRERVCVEDSDARRAPRARDLAPRAP